MNAQQQVQAIAKSVLKRLGPSLIPEDTERTIAERAWQLLGEEGIERTWYYNCPAFVLLGSRSCLSISGRDYVPAEEAIGSTNMVTVDLSPLWQDTWGDCARPFYIEEGRFVATPTRPDFQRGQAELDRLHALVQTKARPQMTFEELHGLLGEHVKANGFESIDFLGNFGHSIEKDVDDRIYVEAGNQTPLGEVSYFTVEPHIREVGDVWGFKWEEIYTFGVDGIAYPI